MDLRRDSKSSFTTLLTQSLIKKQLTRVNLDLPPDEDDIPNYTKPTESYANRNYTPPTPIPAYPKINRYYKTRPRPMSVAYRAPTPKGHRRVQTSFTAPRRVRRRKY